MLTYTYWIVYLIFFLASSAGLWRLFEKVGENKWSAVIPLYQRYVLYKISFGRGYGWLSLVEFIPWLGSAVAIVMNIKLAKAFSKGTGYIFFLIFLAPIAYIDLGFGDEEYLGVQQINN